MCLLLKDETTAAISGIIGKHNRQWSNKVLKRLTKKSPDQKLLDAVFITNLAQKPSAHLGVQEYYS